MRLKRLAAMLLALPLVHVNVARAAIACDRHEAAATETSSAHGHDAHAMHGSRSPDEQPVSRHDLPAGDSETAECCQALASCSLAFGGGDVQSLDRAPYQHSRAPSALAGAPRSRISAPEPPPPKA